VTATIRLALTAIAVLLAWPAAAQQTLDAVRKRGELLCGVNGSLPGFSLLNAVKQWEGLDVDLCRAVAAAVLGDARKVSFVPTTAVERFDKLAAGAFDVLVRNSTVTLRRVAGTNVSAAAVNYYDGQAFMVAKRFNVNRLLSLRGANVCVTRGTTHEANMVAWFKARQLAVTPLPFETPDAMYDAFFAARCLAATADATALAATLARRDKGAAYAMLTDVISKEPLGPYVRADDRAWLEIVRWTHNAMVQAEELDVSSRNATVELQSNDPAVRELLGEVPGNGKALGLDERWAYNVIRQVGNYGEAFERNLGQGSPFGFARGLNALWTKGGLMYPFPMR
jgi:general L-amino acid transport system substrate-binding protein